MLRKVLVIVAVAAITVFCLSGCKKSSDESGSESGRQVQPPKTIAEYEADAEKEITKDNIAEELDKLEKEIEAESRLQP